MATSFTQDERERIIQSLRQRGRERFIRTGIRKTSVDEITRDVGIAKGTFYRFYPSKEALFYDIFETEEDALRTRYLREFSEKPLTRKRFKDFLLAAIRETEKNPILRVMIDPDEYRRLMLKLPREASENHAVRDLNSLRPLVIMWQNEGWMIREKPEIIFSAIRSFFLFIFSRQEIGPDLYEPTLALYADALAHYLVNPSTERIHD